MGSDGMTQAAERWAAQVGFALTGAQVAELLGRSEQAISSDPGLLRLPHSDGRLAYPAFQFDGGRQVPGVAEIVKALDGALTPAGVAAWLTGANDAFGRRRPIELLAAGDLPAVLSIARRLAGRARQ